MWPEFTDNIPMCSFALDQSNTIDCESRTAVIGMAGNAMHAQVCGVVLLYALTQVKSGAEYNECLQTAGLSALAANLAADFDFS